MVSLKLQKRLAASVLGCGLRKVWLDPNEVNEISMANSSTYNLQRVEPRPPAQPKTLTAIDPSARPRSLISDAGRQPPQPRDGACQQHGCPTSSWRIAALVDTFTGQLSPFQLLPLGCKLTVDSPRRPLHRCRAKRPQAHQGRLRDPQAPGHPLALARPRVRRGEGQGPPLRLR